jgi:hypothetical protein
MLDTLAPGDVVTVTRIDRLARSTFDLFAMVKRIVAAKAQFRSLAEPRADTGRGTGRLDDCRVGRLGRHGARSNPHPHGRGPQPGAEARAAHGQAPEIDAGVEGRGPPATGAGSDARGTRAQLRRGIEYEFATVANSLTSDNRSRRRRKREHPINHIVPILAAHPRNKFWFGC